MNDFISVLPRNRTDLELTLEEAGSLRIEGTPIPLKDADDPLRIPLAALPFLAWERTTGVWDDTWPDWLKRRAVERSIYLRKRTGTLEAYDGWLDLLGADIVDYVAPPIGCFATEGQTKEQRAAYLARFAQLRITLRRSPGPGETGAFYATKFSGRDAYCFADEGFALESTAYLRYGRKATLWDQGIETEVIWGAAGRVEASNVVLPVERIIIPGLARPSEPFVDHMWVGGPNSYAEPHETTSKIFTLGTNRVPQLSERFPTLQAEADPLRVVSVTPDRVSEISFNNELSMFTGSMVDSFADINSASDRYYDRYYILDENRMPARQAANYGTFADYSYIDIEPFSAELRVNYPGTVPMNAAATEGFEGMFPFDSSGRLNRIADAVRAGKAARDKIYFTAQTKRIRTFEDGIPLDGSYRFGDLITIARGST